MKPVLWLSMAAACYGLTLPTRTHSQAASFESSSFEERLRRGVEHWEHALGKRQAAPAPSSILDPNTGLTAEWSNQTEALCEQTLTALNGNAGNPSGMAVCYNLPYLNKTAGVFQADLRLFKVAEPSGDWAGVATNNINLNLAYLGATVSNQMRLRLRSLMKRAQAPEMVKSFQFVGKINQNLLQPSMNASELQSLLLPVITVSGMAPNNKMVNATLSSNMTTFINGVFAGSGTPITGGAQASATALANSERKFTVPGRQVAIFPTGLIVTLAWTLLFLTNIAWGTYGRFQFREQYRRRVSRGQEAKTI